MQNFYILLAHQMNISTDLKWYNTEYIYKEEILRKKPKNKKHRKTKVLF